MSDSVTEWWFADLTVVTLVSEDGDGHDEHDYPDHPDDLGDPDDLDVSGNTWEVKMVAPARAVFRPSGFFLIYFF